MTIRSHKNLCYLDHSGIIIVLHLARSAYRKLAPVLTHAAQRGVRRLDER